MFDGRLKKPLNEAPQTLGFRSKVDVFTVPPIAGWTYAKLVGAIAFIALVSLATYWWTSDKVYSAEVSTEAANLRRLVQSLEKDAAGQGFADLSVRQAVLRKSIPAPMLRPQGHPVQSVWGTNIDLRPHSVRTPADGFSVLYQKVPSADCQGLAMVMGPSAHDLKISGQGVMGAQGPEPSLVQAQCSGDQGAPMEFVFHSDLVPGTALPKP